MKTRYQRETGQACKEVDRECKRCGGAYLPYIRNVRDDLGICHGCRIGKVPIPASRLPNAACACGSRGGCRCKGGAR